MSDWKSVLGPLANAAGPVLGGLIGGPAGAAIGAAVGQGVSAALGVEATPEAVQAAIEKNPDRAAEVVRQLAADPSAVTALQALAEADARMVETVNLTARREADGDAVQRWARPAVTYAFAVVFLLHGLAFTWAIVRGDWEAFKIIDSLTIYYGTAGAVVGVATWRRTTEKLAAVQAIPAAAGAVAETVGKAVRAAAKAAR